MPVFENIILCPDALSGRESASMATFFDMALLLVYSILTHTKLFGRPKVCAMAVLSFVE